MHNNYFFLRPLAAELRVLLVGSTLEAAFSQDKDEVVLAFSGGQFLKCVLKPDFAVITMPSAFHRARKNSASLWEDLYGEEVKDVRVGRNERALRIELQSTVMVIKLFRPNLLLFGKSLRLFNNRLISDKDLRLEDFDRDIDASFAHFQAVGYRKQFFTLGKDLLRYLDEKTEGLDEEAVWEEVQTLLKYLEQPSFYLNRELPALSLLGGEPFPTAVEAVNAFASAWLRSNGVEYLRQQMLQKLKKDLQKTRVYIEDLGRKRELLLGGLKNEEIGHLIMAHLHIVPEGASEVVLPNFYGEGEVTVRLKKDLSAQKNAEAYYRKSKNEKIELDTLQENIQRAEERALALEVEMENIGNLEDIKSLRSAGKSSAPVEDLPFKEFIYKDTKIWVGRNAKNNDLLLTRYTHKEEWWLHARDAAGSHVVIKDPKPKREVVEFAASLAAYYSKRKHEGLVTVMLTQKKFVRKAKNLAAGQVIVDKEETLLVPPLSGL
jgi:predicted ribosome quality control (RQC) complex YloA/Tae2 family protein